MELYLDLLSLANVTQKPRDDVRFWVLIWFKSRLVFPALYCQMNASLSINYRFIQPSWSGWSQPTQLLLCTCVSEQFVLLTLLNRQDKQSDQVTWYDVGDHLKERIIKIRPKGPIKDLAHSAGWSPKITQINLLHQISLPSTTWMYWAYVSGLIFVYRWSRRREWTAWPCGSCRMPVEHAACGPWGSLKAGWSCSWSSGWICTSIRRFPPHSSSSLGPCTSLNHSPLRLSSRPPSQCFLTPQ